MSDYQPQEWNDVTEDYRVGTILTEEFPYQIRIESAKRWLGDRYVCAKPINKRAA
jgi:hypothetical protein